jgi:hypothetical protein
MAIVVRVVWVECCGGRGGRVGATENGSRDWPRGQEATAEAMAIGGRWAWWESEGDRGDDDGDGDEDRSRSGFGRWTTDFLGAGEQADRPGGKERAETLTSA